jgi:hypothetical protein
MLSPTSVAGPAGIAAPAGCSIRSSSVIRARVSVPSCGSRAGGPIAPIVVAGSRAHDIAPIRSHALTIGAKGGGPIRAFAARVHHPGTRPDPFVADALAGSIESADRELELAGDRIASSLAVVMEG